MLHLFRRNVSVDRRQVLRDAAAGVVACWLPSSDVSANEPRSLKQIAAERGLFFGACVQNAHLRDSVLAQALARECSLVAPEWEMKWRPIEADKGETYIHEADNIVAFAQRERLAVCGHALVWHESIPNWAKTELLQTKDWRLIETFIRRVLGHFAGRVDQWDVLNEIVEPRDGRDDGLRNSPFLGAFGTDYVLRSLELARKLAPKALLFINEYYLDYDGPLERARRTAMLKLMARLISLGAPLDALGIQAHLRLDGRPFSEAALRRFLADVADLGIKIVITELDVKEFDFAAPVPERDRRVAAEVSRYLDVVFDERAVIGVTTWGLSDRYSWLTTPEMKASGRINRGLPFDADLVAKPMANAIAASLRNAPMRDPRRLTLPDGTVQSSVQ